MEPQVREEAEQYQTRIHQSSGIDPKPCWVPKGPFWGHVFIQAKAPTCGLPACYFITEDLAAGLEPALSGFQEPEEEERETR